MSKFATLADLIEHAHQSAKESDFIIDFRGKRYRFPKGATLDEAASILPTRTSVGFDGRGAPILSWTDGKPYLPTTTPTPPASQVKPAPSPSTSTYDPDQIEADRALVAEFHRHQRSGSVDSRFRERAAAAQDRLDAAAELAAFVPASESTWAAVDLTPFLDGSYVAPQATIMPRQDGQCLMYPGKIHSFHGESESGKSLLVQIEAARLVGCGQDVLYVDFEDSPAGVALRLVEFGAPAELVARHLTYVRPDSKLMGNEPGWQEILSRSYALAVIDGVTDSLSMFGLSTQDNDEIAKWQRALPRKIAAETGAAVAMIDHVTKSTEGRGRFAIGGQAKIAGLDGCAYTVETDPTPRKGHKGTIVVRIGKDRPGNVRPHCGPPRGTDRTQEAVRVEIDSTKGVPVVTWHTPSDVGSDGTTQSKDVARHVKLTGVAERISKVLVNAGQGKSKSALFGEVGGNKGEFDAALERLAENDYVKMGPASPGKPILVESLKPYLAVNDGAEKELWEGWNRVPTTGSS